MASLSPVTKHSNCISLDMEADTPLMDSGNAPEEAVVRIYPELLFSIMLTRGAYSLENQKQV